MRVKLADGTFLDTDGLDDLGGDLNDLCKGLVDDEKVAPEIPVEAPTVGPEPLEQEGLPVRSDFLGERDYHDFPIQEGTPTPEHTEVTPGGEFVRVVDPPEAPKSEVRPPKKPGRKPTLRTISAANREKDYEYPEIQERLKANIDGLSKLPVNDGMQKEVFCDYCSSKNIFYVPTSFAGQPWVVRVIKVAKEIEVMFVLCADCYTVQILRRT